MLKFPSAWCPAEVRVESLIRSAAAGLEGQIFQSVAGVKMWHLRLWELITSLSRHLEVKGQL